jgi:O-antigen/teichoic acid export membrane protein
LKKREGKITITFHELWQQVFVRLSATPATPKREQYDAYVGRIARGAGVSSFGRGIGQALRFTTQVALARMYGPTQLGLYVLGITLVQLATTLSQLGIEHSVVRYVAEYKAKSDTSRVRGTILLALWVTLALSLVLACLMFFGAGFLAEKIFAEPSLDTIFRVFSVAVPFLTVMSIALFATQGFQTVKYQTYVQHILQPLIALGLMVVLYLLGMQILGAVAAYILSIVLGSVLALYYLKRVFPRLLDRDMLPEFESRALFSVAVPMSVVRFAQSVNQWGTVAVVGIFVTAQDVGIYNAAVSTGNLSILVLFAFSGIFGPLVSSLYSRGLLDDLRLLYQDVCRWIFAGSLAIFLLTVFLAKDVMAVFGEEFVPGWPAMILIAGAQVFDSSTGPTHRVLAMTGRQKMLMLAMLGSTVVTLTASVALIPLYGILGAAVGRTVGIILYSIATVLFVHQLLGVWPYNQHYLKLLVAGLSAAAITSLMKLMLPLPAGPPAILILSPLFLAVFVTMLLALRLSASDRVLLRALWKMVRRTTRQDT